MSAVNALPFLVVPSMSSRRRALHARHDEDDAFLSSDLELSFASNVSLSSPPRNHVDLTPDSEYGVPMDISPLPPPKRASVDKPTTRPRASTVSARLFGNDVSNKDSLRVTDTQRGRSESISNAKRTQRPGLPLEWRSAQPPSPMDDAMDVDTSFIIDPPAPLPSSISSPVIPQSVTSASNFSHLFYDTQSPLQHRNPPKRRSLSPDDHRYKGDPLSSSPGIPPSPSDRPASRTQIKPFILGQDLSLHKRPRRPTLSSTFESDTSSVRSAFPTLESLEDINSQRPIYDHPPTRRAFSATIPPLGGPFSPDSSFEEPDASSPAQAYARRQHAKIIRRRDGSDDFRPSAGATALIQQESPSRRVPASGMPGFGDNERVGKILPCRSVPEDGLMRISLQTLNALLDGAFNDRIHDFHVIDCRFEYEYAGGHIPGAVNINTPTVVESLLLGPSLTKPKPSVSGDEYRKTVLIFHCEFSQKRAPTFAKHLRAKDRSMNHGVYPRIHYPEVYVLEGGYCAYYKAFSERCTPSAYVPMDDPSHAAARGKDMDQFRKNKFGRHKSYAYGDGSGRLAAALQPSKRNTMPTNNNSTHVFAAGSAARARRGGSGSGSLSTLNESSGRVDDDESDTDLGDSPCPRQTHVKKPRATLSRAETYGPSRMPF